MRIYVYMERETDIHIYMHTYNIYKPPLFLGAWVEVDLLDLAPVPLRTQQTRLRPTGCSLDFAHAVPIKAGGAAAAALRDALSSPDDKESDLFFNLMGVGPSGTAKLVGNAYVNLKQLWMSGRDLDEASLPIRRAQVRFGLEFGPHKIFFQVEAFVHESIIL